MTKTPIKRKKGIKTLKRKLWSAFSEHIRKKYADHAGYVTTCDTGERVPWQETDCGHLLANTERSKGLGGNELWYYENNFAPQSRGGNRFNAQEAAKWYMYRAMRMYGEDEIIKMAKMKATPKKWTEEELTELYQQLLSTS